MIIRPNPEKINLLYTSLSKNAVKLSNCCIAISAIFPVCIVTLIFLISGVSDNMRSMSGDDLLTGLPIAAIIGAVIGFLLKFLVKNFMMKLSVTLINELKNTGVKIENDLIIGRMMKADASPSAVSNPSVQVIPRTSCDVAFRMSQISNIDVSDKVIQGVDYSKFCTVSVGADKYYLMCIGDEDAYQLRNYFLYPGK